jgi:putative SOS response-associated peptidase YedK
MSQSKVAQKRRRLHASDDREKGCRFGLHSISPVFAFAGVWTDWHGIRGTKANPIEGDHRIYAFLTCKPNAIVKAVHAKAMPVILRSPEEHDVWMRAP